MNGSNSDLIKQIHAARKYALNGLILFDYAHLNDSYVNTLTESIFRPVKKEIVITESYTPVVTVTKPQQETQRAKKKRGRRK